MITLNPGIGGAFVLPMAIVFTPDYNPSPERVALEVLSGKAYCDTHKGWHQRGEQCPQCSSGILRLARAILLPPRQSIALSDDTVRKLNP